MVSTDHNHVFILRRLLLVLKTMLTIAMRMSQHKKLQLMNTFLTFLCEHQQIIGFVWKLESRQRNFHVFVVTVSIVTVIVVVFGSVHGVAAAVIVNLLLF